jgi:hypothetical protein
MRNVQRKESVMDKQQKLDILNKLLEATQADLGRGQLVMHINEVARPYDNCDDQDIRTLVQMIYGANPEYFEGLGWIANAVRDEIMRITDPGAYYNPDDLEPVLGEEAYAQILAEGGSLLYVIRLVHAQAYYEGIADQENGEAKQPKVDRLVRKNLNLPEEVQL